MIAKGDIVLIKPEFQDEGDSCFTWAATSDEEKGRVTIAVLGTGLSITPTATVPVYMLDPVANAVDVGCEPVSTIYL